MIYWEFKLPKSQSHLLGIRQRRNGRAASVCYKKAHIIQVSKDPNLQIAL